MALNISSNQRHFWSFINESQSSPNSSSTVFSIEWNVNAVSQILTTVLAFSLNLLVVAFLVKFRHLQTSFTIYLISLCSTNVLYAVLNSPFDIYAQIYGWIMGNAACAISLYSAWVFSAMAIHSHALITANRVWATFFPISYRNSHNKKWAVVVS